MRQDRKRDRWIDVTRPLDQALPVYPGDPRPGIRTTTDRQGITISSIEMSTHTGTHIDLPGHIRRGAKRPDEGSLLAALIGTAHLIAVGRRRSRAISRDEIIPLVGSRPPRRLLLRTGCSGSSWRGLAPDAADWLAGRSILVGTDALSIDPPGDRLDSHRALLERGTVVLENLRLERALPGSYHLIALPLLLPAPDGAPARVLLRKLGGMA